MEKRLIDSNALLKKLSRMIDYCQYNKLEDEMSALFQVGDAVMDCPTVDAVPVVRCKDCKWFNASGCAIYIVDDTDKPKEDDFCSFGERRTEGD